MTRREFITLLGGAAAAWPLAARAQQPERVPAGRISPWRSRPPNSDWGLSGFRPRTARAWLCRGTKCHDRISLGRGSQRTPLDLRRVGPTQGRCHCHGVATRRASRPSRRPSLIPIVFALAGDPVGNGLVASLATGRQYHRTDQALRTDTAGKRLELLREWCPDLRVGDSGQPWQSHSWQC